MKAEAAPEDRPAWTLEPGRIVVRGAFRRSAIETLANVGLPEIAGPEVEVNLGQVREIDTAGLAMLLGWQGEGQARGVHLRYTHAPRAMTAMMQAYGLEGLLDVAERRR